mmetsp:Transcript_11455/g.17256  ORF Transcript_11455/g.17256 Transcript_11455/m.17256 type:complete len:177 (+) Transcript_11455:261-791(+)
MFETKNGSKYMTYNGINDDIFTWKSYENSTEVVENNHNLLELKFDLSDAVLMGTENHLEKMNQVISRYQIRVDQNLVKQDSLKECLDDPACSSIIDDSMASMFNALVEEILSGYETMSASERTAATASIKTLSSLAQSEEQDDKMQLMESYYIDFLPVKVEDLEAKKQSNLEGLVL